MKAISKLNGRRVTIQQVAKEAGVSSSTVSRVLTGNTSVRKDLRLAVRQAVERLAYRPNQIARSLKIRETTWLGLTRPRITSWKVVTFVLAWSVTYPAE